MITERVAYSLVGQKQKRLLVLVPACLANNTDLAHKIHWMADHENRAVLYLVLADRGENDLAVSRCMATMKAVTSANRLPVEVKRTESGQWLKTLREIAGPGDVIVCPEEQMVYTDHFRMLPVSDFLSGQLNTPVHTISGFYHPTIIHAQTWFHELFTLLGYLAIIAVFTWVEIKLDRVLDDPLAAVLVMAAFGVELGAVWAWYKFDRRKG